MANNPPVKSFSFDSRIHDDNKNNDKDIVKSFSFAFRGHSEFNDDVTKSETDHHHSSNNDNVIVEEPDEVADQEISLDQLSKEVVQFVNSISSLTSTDDGGAQPLEIPNAVAKFLKKLESRIEEYSDAENSNSVTFGNNFEEDSSFIASVTQLSSLVEAFSRFKSVYTMPLLNQATSVLHRTMVFLEEELRFLLEESDRQNSNPDSNSKHADSSSKHLKGRQQSFAVSSQQGGEFCVLPDRKSESTEELKETSNSFPSFSTESLSTIRLISNAMISSGYESEFCNVFIIARRYAFKEELNKQGFEKISVDDVQKMSWEPLEAEIASWIRIFKHCSSHLFPGEHEFYQNVLADHPIIRRRLFADLCSAVYSVLVNFAEAVAMAKRSTEKLFKFLDMYETLRDLNRSMDTTTGNDDDDSNSISISIYPEECVKELRSELSFAGNRLGEAAVSIFCQLENSIKSDNAKTPVASGAVHPLTRYTMNYLKYACEYKDTLEQVFLQHLSTKQPEEYPSMAFEKKNNDEKQSQSQSQSPFASQLQMVMELLDANLEAKSNLYKDPSLRYIFLMNNGRYMLQKVKGSTEIHQVVGDDWCRKRSATVRNCHKSYQRETWSKVLQCLNQEGLQVNGKVSKPVLKERFKNFNQLFDEIHKTQSTWVVSDEQLQSELRVSISAVMIPAYRSFVSRFGQIFSAGRQTEKYIKYQPEDIETVIEELFDGNPNSMVRRRT